MKKPLYILKIGGSVATYKNKPGFSIRKNLIKKVAKAIKQAQTKKNFDLILIHGAGAGGHQLAHQYNLKNGATNAKKIKGALLSQIANQKLDTAIMEILVNENLKIVPAHTASTIIYQNNQLKIVNDNIILESLRQNFIPMLYGEMVFDTKLKMAICSGDIIATYLAKKLNASKIFFASDIDGIFDKDPHTNKNAKLIKNIDIKNIFKKTKLTESHNIDTTGGLLGKIKNIVQSKNPNLKTVEIFDGFNPKNFEKIILNKKFPHTTIKLK